MARQTVAAILCLTALTGSASAGPPTPIETLRDAAEVVEHFSKLPLTCIPPALISDAAAVAVIPNVVKAGFVVGGRHGRGVVLCREPGGRWTDPKFVRLTGAGVGLQAGIEAADVVLVFKTRSGLDRVLSGKRSLTLGGDAAVAAGPVGRDATAATNPRLKAEIFSYARSRGLFAGVSLEGTVLAPDPAADKAFRREADSAEARALAELAARLSKAAGDLPRDVPLIRREK